MWRHFFQTLGHGPGVFRFPAEGEALPMTAGVRITLAQAMGTCFGVQDAIDMAHLPFRVDVDRWNESMEAWWPVIIDTRRRGLLPRYEVLEELDGRKGYLVTPNCD